MLSRLIQKAGYSLAKLGAEALKVSNLAGDRAVRGPWITLQMLSGPDGALDSGLGSSDSALVAALAGFNVTAVDLFIKDYKN